MQQDEILSREVVAEFFKDTGGRIKLNSLIVIREEKSRHDGKIYIAHDQYDVDWSREFGYLYHMSGSGLPAEVCGIYYVSGSTKVKERPCTWVDGKDSPPWQGAKTLAIRKRNHTRRMARLPKAFDLEDGEDLFDWLERNGIEGDAVYCNICRDYFPGSDGWNLCKHCWWCDKTGDYSTPSERCGCKEREECDEERQ